MIILCLNFLDFDYYVCLGRSSVFLPHGLKSFLKTVLNSFLKKYLIRINTILFGFIHPLLTSWIVYNSNVLRTLIGFLGEKSLLFCLESTFSSKYVTQHLLIWIVFKISNVETFKIITIIWQMEWFYYLR